MHSESTMAEAAVSPPIPLMPAGLDATVERQQDPAELMPARAAIDLPEEKSKRTLALKTLALQAFKRINWITVVLGIFGILIICTSFIGNFSSLLSVSLALAGISIVSVSIIYFFISPTRLVSRDVCDAILLSDVELMNTLLEPLAGDSKGVYIPASIVGVTQVMVMTKDAEFSKAYNSSAESITGISSADKSCLFLTPPGYGLLSYVKSLGASFTDEGLADEIKDVLVNGLELVTFVEVTRTGDSLAVRVGELSNSPICKAMRQKGRRACDQIGCPICSFISCMVAEGTGRPAMVSDMKLDEKAIELTYKLM